MMHSASDISFDLNGDIRRGINRMRTTGNHALAAAFVVALLWPAFTDAEQLSEPGASDTEIRIGSIMPYTGSLAAFGAIGRAEAAYFDMINDRGGINGRKVRLEFSANLSSIEITLE